MRVLLACEPAILNEVVARAIGDLPGVELVDESQGAVDVVVLSGAGTSLEDWPTGLAGNLAPDARLIILDPETNAARVWQGGTAPSETLLPGNLATVRRLLQPASS